MGKKRRKCKNAIAKEEKKGLAVSQLIAILLIIFVTLVLLGMGKVVAQWLSKLLGFVINPDTQASVLALRCAINSVAAGYINDETCIGEEKIVGTPIYYYDEAIMNAEEATLTSPTGEIMKDFHKVSRFLKNKITGMLGLAQADEQPVAYRFRDSVVVCGNSTMLNNPAYWVSGTPSTQIINGNFTELNNDGPMRCKIFYFLLEQKVTKYKWYDPKTWTAIFGDPKYVVYSEKFDESIRENWRLHEEEFIPIAVIGTSAAMSFLFDCLPGIGKAAGKMAKAGIEKVAGEAGEKLSATFIEKTAESGWRAALVRGLKTVGSKLKKDDFSRMDPFREEIAKALGTTKEEIPHTIAAGALTSYDSMGEEGLKRYLKELGVPDSEVDATASKIIAKSSSSAIESAKKLMSFEAAIEMAKAFEKPMAEAVKGIDDETLKEILKGIPPRYKEAWSEAIPKGMTWEEYVDSLGENGVGEAANSVLSLEKMKLLAKHSIKGYAHIYSTKKRIATGAAITLSMIGMFRLDAMSDLIDSPKCGTNELCIHYNNFFGEYLGFDTISYKLHDSVKKYYLATQVMEPDWYHWLVGGNLYEKFYLASPCVSDIVVRRGTCECKYYYPADDIYMQILYESILSFPSLDEGYDYSSVQSTSTLTLSQLKTKIKDKNLADEFENEMEIGLDSATPGDVKLWIMKWNYLDPSERKDRANKIIGLGSLTEDVIIHDVIIQNMKVNGEAYRKCVPREDWVYALGGLGGIFSPVSQNIDCIIIKSTSDSMTSNGKYSSKVLTMGSNFCYEKNNDWTDAARAGTVAAEIGAGTALGILAGMFSGGTLALPAYCAGSIAISVISGGIAEKLVIDDKWPYGIIQ